MATPFLRLALLYALGFLAGFGGPAGAAELHAADGLEIRWDNTLRYSTAFRLYHPDTEPLSYSNGDDGDRNFAPGIGLEPVRLAVRARYCIG